MANDIDKWANLLKKYGATDEEIGEAMAQPSPLTGMLSSPTRVAQKPLSTMQRVDAANADMQDFYKQTEKQALADRLANKEMQMAYVDSLKPQVDLSPALAFFGDWAKNNAGISGYKKPAQVTEKIAASQKLFPTDGNLAEQSKLAALKAKLEAATELKKSEDDAIKAKNSFDANDMLRNQLMQMQVMGINRENMEREQKKEVPGYIRQTGVSPTDKDTETLKGIRSKYESASAGLNELKNLVNANGIEILPTDAKRRMESVYSDLKVQLKELANLGALTGPDMAIIEQQLKDPTSLMNAFQAQGVLESIDQTLQNAKSRVQSEAVARGFEPTFIEPTAGKKRPGGNSGEAMALPADVREVNGVKFKKVEGGWEEVQ
jgi:hypothetical protein